MATQLQEEGLRILADFIKEGLQEVYGEDMVFMLNIARPNEQKGVSDYISNGTRSDCIRWMKETIERFEQNETIPASIGSA